jgi:hypothetical protein
MNDDDDAFNDLRTLYERMIGFRMTNEIMDFTLYGLMAAYVLLYDYFWWIPLEGALARHPEWEVCVAWIYRKRIFSVDVYDVYSRKRH